MLLYFCIKLHRTSSIFDERSTRMEEASAYDTF